MIENQGLDRSNSVLRERAQLSDRLRGTRRERIALSIIERQNNIPRVLGVVRTLGEVRKNKLAAAMHRSVLEVDAVHSTVTSFRGSIQWTLVKRSKGARRMPRRGQAKKDVASCEKPW